MTAAPSRRPAPEPLDVDAVRILTGGTVLWFVGFAVLLPFHRRLADSGHELWLWTCLAGWLLGMAGVLVAYRQRSRVRRSRAGRCQGR